MSHDDAGWWIGPCQAWPIATSYSILAREDDSRIVAARWTHQAKRFFAADLSVTPDKTYDAGWPRHDRATLHLAPRGGDALAVAVQTLPADETIRAAAMKGAEAIGGAGLDRLVARSPRLWQVRAEDDRIEALAAAAVVASLVLGPILPPAADVVYGVKGARERLAARGWRT